MKILSLVSLFLFGFLATCNQVKVSPLHISVSGNKFVDGNQNTIIFKGLNASDPDKLDDDGMWTQRYFDEIKAWGANLVRFPVHPSAWRERGEEGYLELLDRGITMADEADLYVLIDWHSIGNLATGKFQHERYFTTKKETLDFWETIASRYGSNPSVAFFELFNEPTTMNGELGEISWSEWKEMMEELIQIIRKEKAKAIPLVAGFDWAYDLKEAAAEPIDAEGIAYVSHPYPMKRSQPWEAAWDSDWGHMAEKYPLLLTEIGFCEEGERGAHIPVIDDGTYVKAITDYADKKGVSFIIWVFDKDWSPHMFEDWDFTPSKSGQVWKNYLSRD